MSLRHLPDAIRRYEAVRKENDAGVIVGLCLFVGLLVLVVGILLI